MIVKALAKALMAHSTHRSFSPFQIASLVIDMLMGVTRLWNMEFPRVTARR
jgi:hypothetical protein